MAIVDFSNSFGNINKAIHGLGEGLASADQHRSRVGIGDALLAGKYPEAASMAVKAGDLGSGLKIIEMANKRGDISKFNEIGQSLLGGVQFGQPPSTGISTLGAPQPGSPAKPAWAAYNSGGPAPAFAQAQPTGPARDFNGIFSTVEQQFKLPPGYLSRTAQIESSGNPNAANPNSSARGLFQFIPGTAKQYGLTDPFDPEASTNAAGRLAMDNANVLRQGLGREPNAAELYLAHQQGAGGAMKLLSNPNVRAADVVGEKAVRLNGGRPDMTAGEFAGLWLNKFGGQRGQGGRSTQVAQATPQAAQMAQAGIERVDMLLNDPQTSPQERERLTGLRQQYAQAGQQGQQQPDLPAQGSMEAQQAFVIPGTGQTVPAGTRLTQKAVGLMKMLQMDVPDGYKEPYRILLKQELDAANPATQLDIEGKRLSNEEARQRLNGGQISRQASERAQIAEQYGLQLGTPEHRRFVMTGQLPNDSAPVTKQIKQADGSEVAVQWDSSGNRWVPLTAPEGGNAVRPNGMKLTEGQSKDLVYYNRGTQALQEFEPIGDAYASGVERTVSGLPFGNYAVSEKYQKAEQSGRNLLASILRKDTGAAITVPEEKQYGDIFLPRPGDQPGTLALKRKARSQALEAIKTGLGPAQILAVGSETLGSGQGQQGVPARINSPQEYQSLPSGATFVAPDGSTRRKP